MTKPVNLLDTLDDILDREKDALLTGRFDLLGQILEEKDAVLEELSKENFAASPSVEAVAKKAETNQLYLQEAMAGIRSVAQKLASIRRVQKSLDTYTARGEKLEIKTNAPSGLEKRM